MADIEFLAQYWALRWAREFPPVIHFPDTIRQLESVASAALVPQETVDVLVQAYQRYRQAAHRRSLEGQEGVVDATQFEAERLGVAAIWRDTMVSPYNPPMSNPATLLPANASRIYEWKSRTCRSPAPCQK